jgi:hypothetical protein
MPKAKDPKSNSPSAASVYAFFLPPNIMPTMHRRQMAIPPISIFCIGSLSKHIAKIDVQNGEVLKITVATARGYMKALQHPG